MRPLELVIEGFRSYAERATFDFRERRLVAIVGPIGSGKSSLLDAIAFALYGRTPVFSRESHTLINQRLDRARVELLFEAAGTLWRVVRVIRRRGASKHTLYRYDDDAAVRAGKAAENLEKAGLVGDKIEQLLGLDFQGFCRSVLLAQGRFAEFLAAPRGERDKVLKGVFGFDRIDEMRERALSRRSQAEREVARIEGQLSAARDIDAQLGAARETLQRASQRAAELDAAAPEVQAIEAQLLAAGRDIETCDAQQARLESIAEPLPSRDDVLTICEQLRQASETSREALRLRDAARAALDEARKAKERCERETGGAAALERASAALEALAERRQQALVLAERVAKLQVDLQRDDKARSEQHAAQAASQRALVQQKRATSDAQRAATQADEALAQLRARGPDEAALERASRAMVTLAHLADDAARLSQELSAIDEAAQHNAAARLELESANAGAAARVTQAEAAHELARERALERERALDAARGQQMAAALRDTLTPGDDCPVCEQPVATLPHGAPPAAVSAAEMALVDAREQLERRAGELTDARQALARGEQTASDLFDRAAEIAERYEEVDERWSQARARVERSEAEIAEQTGVPASGADGDATAAVAAASDDEAAMAAAVDPDDWIARRAARRETLQEAIDEGGAQLAAAIDSARAAHEAVDLQQRALRDAEAALALCESRAQAADESLQRASDALGAARGDAAELAAAIDKAQAQLRDQLGEGDAEQRLAALRAQLHKASAEHAAALVALDEADQRRRQARDAQRASAKQRRRVEQKLDVAAARLELAEAAPSAGADGSPQLELGLDGERDAEAIDALDQAIRAGLEEHRAAAQRARAAAEARVAQAAAQRSERLRSLGIGAEDHQSVTEASAGDEQTEGDAVAPRGPPTLDAARGAAHSARDSARAELDRLAAQAARARALLDELSAASARVTRATQLADDLRADRFLRYLLDEERGALSELGSARFEMLSGGRYRFTEDGQFRVVDLANAEQERKAETLSGGETFLASLALALALAERVSGAGGRGLDAFFLDEGFGTLDAEHLELALEGIERLVVDAPRRLVALVSHVPALRERIDDRIELDRDPLTGNTHVLRGASAPQAHAEPLIDVVGRRLASVTASESTRTP